MSQVVVAHPNIQHSLQLAVALSKANLLQTFLTRLYFSYEHFPFSTIKWLPTPARRQIEQKVFQRYRRNHPELHPSNIQSVKSVYPFLQALLHRSGLISTPTYFRRLNESGVDFQNYVADYILRNKSVQAVVCYDRHAYATFSRLLDSPTKLILDLSSVHARSARRILKEEIERHPEFRESLSKWIMTADRVEQPALEASMADHILAGSSFVRNTCIENGIDPEKITVLPYGTDLAQLPPAAPRPADQPFRILFAGQIGQAKGIKYLLEAFKQLELNDAELWLCGNMTDKSALAPYRDHFHHLGHIPYKDMAVVYDSIDVFVLPTLFEGLSQVCLEAMARARPVITTPNSGITDILRDGRDGFIIPIRDVDCLSEKLLFFYDNREACVAMGQSARESIETYTWERYWAAAANVFSSILSDTTSN